MLLTRLKHHFAAFGADTRRWPTKPHGIWRRLAGSSRFRAERTEAERIDRLLDLWRIETPSEQLAQHICQRALALPQQPVSAIAPPTDIVVWPFASYWPGVATFGLALIMGCLLGWYGGINGTTSEDWLNTAALTPMQEDFSDR
ncbi:MULTISPECIES: hypothetical protein [Methylocaldum]|jgi:hypothetical protein|uniref:hypothetical protein n=1 Tax=unclassified Methylocaldum TaxID=2622260 RepID=UPI00098B2DC8|nr:MULTISPECIES: hypothetical protein [unclassified Methylocaldum]MBP1149683.1 hypothetical protein [Methylocaldum sp. RMAD-M]MDV3242189.1 hypothetical protein [Methylocaldum sp.]MVF20821.1 hypothetical protein [Methylocaldum sp. BRCS4]